MADQAEVTFANLQNAPGSRKERVRVGRGYGYGLGKTAVRGGKGQTARTGKGRPKRFEGGQMPLSRRLPKFGFKSPFKEHYEVVNVSELEKNFSAGETVDAKTLHEKGLLRSESAPLKVLGDGSLSKKLTVVAHKFSKSAIQKINQAGGKAEEIKVPEPQPGPTPEDKK